MLESWEQYLKLLILDTCLWLLARLLCGILYYARDLSCALPYRVCTLKHELWLGSSLVINQHMPRIFTFHTSTVVLQCSSGWRGNTELLFEAAKQTKWWGLEGKMPWVKWEREGKILLDFKWGEDPLFQADFCVFHSNVTHCYIFYSVLGKKKKWSLPMDWETWMQQQQCVSGAVAFAMLE